MRRIKSQQMALSPVIRSGLQLGRWQQTETQIDGAFSERTRLGTCAHKVDSLATDSEDPSSQLSVNVILGLMAEHEIPFFLEIVGAARLNADGRLAKPPNTYVTVQVNSFTARTKLVKRSSSPTWSKEFKFAARPSSMLCFRVKHQPNIVQPRQMLGVVEMQISELLELGKDQQDVILKLAGPSNTDNLDCGEIIIHFWAEEQAKASAMAMAEAKQVVDEKLEGKESAAKSMETVVLKLKVFAEIIDEAANLHPYINLVWTVLSSVYKVVKNQLERDQKIINLMAAMEHVYSFVDEIQSIPEKVKSLEQLIKTILQQTFECAIFIQDYSGLGFTSADIFYF